MKLSLLITYYNRRNLLENTLKSLQRSASNGDFQVLIADDASSAEHRIEDFIEKYPELNIKIHRFEPEEKTWTLQIPCHNKLIAWAIEEDSDIMIHLGAEMYHVHDIITDAISNTKDGEYRCYGCYNLSEEQSNKLQESENKGKQFEMNPNTYIHNEWYEHSIHSPRGYNFCTSITKKDMFELGGFDERFSLGYGFGDNEFVERIKRKGMNIVFLDNILCYHQHHEKNFEDFYSGKDPNWKLWENSVSHEDIIKVKNSFLDND